MNILIKGMEMPKNEPLLVKINPDRSVSTTAKNGYKKYEAVPVPPHGRLIDADALKDMELETCDTDDGFRTVDRIAGRNRIRQIVKNAPTIIPAEEDRK